MDQIVAACFIRKVLFWLFVLYLLYRMILRAKVAVYIRLVLRSYRMFELLIDPHRPADP